MIIHARMTNFLWIEAINIIAFSPDPMRSQSLLKVTPYQILFNKRPNLLYFRVFRSMPYTWIKKDQRDKFQSRTKTGFFVGYDHKSKGFWIWLRADHKLMISCNVRFDKTSILNGELMTNWNQLQSQDSDNVIGRAAAATPIQIKAKHYTSSPAPNHSSNTNRDLDVKEPNNIVDQIPATTFRDNAFGSLAMPACTSNAIDSSSEHNIIRRHSTLTKESSSRLKNSIMLSCDSNQKLPKLLAPSPFDSDTPHLYIEYDCFFGITKESSDRIHFKEVDVDLNWKEAIEQERNSIIRNNTWKICNLPPGASIVTAI